LFVAVRWRHRERESTVSRRKPGSGRAAVARPRVQPVQRDVHLAAAA